MPKKEQIFPDVLPRNFARLFGFEGYDERIMTIVFETNPTTGQLIKLPSDSELSRAKIKAIATIIEDSTNSVEGWFYNQDLNLIDKQQASLFTLTLNNATIESGIEDVVLEEFPLGSLNATDIRNDNNLATDFEFKTESSFLTYRNPAGLPLPALPFAIVLQFIYELP
jgi:hypothetical protein